MVARDPHSYLQQKHFMNLSSVEEELPRKPDKWRHRCAAKLPASQAREPVLKGQECQDRINLIEVSMLCYYRACRQVFLIKPSYFSKGLDIQGYYRLGYAFTQHKATTKYEKLCPHHPTIKLYVFSYIHSDVQQKATCSGSPTMLASVKDLSPQSQLKPLRSYTLTSWIYLSRL